MARIAGCERGIAHRPEILVPRSKTAAAKMRAADRMTREPAAMSAKMPATAEMRASKAVATAMSAAVTATMATATVPAAAVAATAASGDRGARKHGEENNNRNSDPAP